MRFNYLISLSMLSQKISVHVATVADSETAVLCYQASSHLDDLRKDLSSVLRAARGRVHILLLQEEVNEPRDEGHTGSQILVPSAVCALTVTRHRDVEGLWSVNGKICERKRKGNTS